MKTPMRSTAILILAWIAVACATPREPGSTVPAVGDRAPGLDLPLAGGGTFSLESAVARGPVAVVFYRGRF
jgi:hypothetical protein